MNKITAFLVIVIMTLSFSLGTVIQGKAQNKSFVGVIPFITSNNRLGFFDQSNGRVYMYDDNISQCIFAGQIAELGQPIQVIPKQ